MGEPAPPLDAEEVGHRRPALQVANQDRVDLILLPRPMLDELGSPGDPAAEHPRRLVDRPHLGQEAASEQLGEHGRIDLVCLRPCLGQPLDRLRVAEHNSLHVRLDDADDRKRVAGRLECHLVAGGQALGEELERRRLRLNAARKAHLPSLGDRHLAEVAVDVEPDEAHHSSSRSLTRRRDGQHDNYGSVLAAHPSSRRGGQLQIAGSQPIEIRQPVRPAPP
jgi:hypothetical protein